MSPRCPVPEGWRCLPSSSLAGNLEFPVEPWCSRSSEENTVSLHLVPAPMALCVLLGGSGLPLPVQRTERPVAALLTARPSVSPARVLPRRWPSDRRLWRLHPFVRPPWRGRAMAVVPAPPAFGT